MTYENPYITGQYHLLQQITKGQLVTARLKCISQLGSRPQESGNHALPTRWALSPSVTTYKWGYNAYTWGSNPTCRGYNSIYNWSGPTLYLNKVLLIMGL